MTVALNKLAFCAKYGSAKHKKAFDGKVHEMMDKGDDTDHQALSVQGNLPLSDKHLDRLIDHKPQAGGTPPAYYVSNFHKDKLNDHHWHKIAMHPEPSVTPSAIAHMPMKHLKTVAENHPDAFVRGLAAGHYTRQKAMGRKK